MRRVMAAVVVVLVASTVARAQKPREQLPEPAFRSGVTRVEVTALVVDDKSAPVPGLEASEFEVLEDGVPQVIRSFVPVAHRPGAIVLPEPVIAVDEHGPAVVAPVTNHHTSDARIFALVLDALHVDPRRTRVSRLAARRLVERLDPSDLLYVVVTGSGRSTGTFSRDRGRALAVIDGFRGERLRDMTMQRLLTSTGDEPQRADHYRRFAETLSRVATALRDVPGRSKTLVLISEGSSYSASIEDLASQAQGGLDEGRGLGGGLNATSNALSLMNDALSAAAASNVVIHPLNPLGLDLLGGDELIEADAAPSDEQLRRIAGEARQARNMLRDLAVWTGGIAAVERNDALGAIDQILDGAGTHYVLTYESSSASTRRDFRRIEVRVKRQGVRVHARRGYRLAEPRPAVLRASDDTLPPPMRALLSQVLPSDALTMRAQAVAVGTTGGQTTYALVVETDGAGVSVTAEGLCRLEQGVLTVDDQGKVGNGMLRSMSFKIPPELQEQLSTTTFRSLWAVTMPSGQHQMRVATLDSATGRGGAVYLDLDVPARTPPADLLVGSRTHAIKPTLFVDDQVKAWADPMPGATRVFPVGDILTVLVPSRESGQARATLATSDGRVVWTSAADDSAQRAAARFEVPLDVVAGTYQLIVESSRGRVRTPIGVVEVPNR